MAKLTETDARNLAKSQEWLVQVALAGNPYIPEDMAKKYSKSYDTYIHRAAQYAARKRKEMQKK